MQISNITTLDTGDWSEISAHIQPDSTSEPMMLFFRFTGLDIPIRSAATPFVLACLQTSMLEGEAVRHEGRLDPGLTDGVARGQEIQSEWFDYLTQVPITGSDKARLGDQGGNALLPGRGVACCFSGGVDSWYSLIKNRESITHLLLVRGFDIDLENGNLWEQALDHARRVADALGLGLITCETNLRMIADPRHRHWGAKFDGDFWGQALHGAALAAVAHAAAGTIGTLIVPATHTVQQFKPWGSSPVLDPQWSGAHLNIVHDGCELDRVRKVFEIAEHAVAVENLRVCHSNTDELNCCRCEKCIRTMIALKLCGALHLATTFPDHHALAKLHRLDVPPHLLHHYEALLEAAQEFGNREMVNVLEVILGRRFSVERAVASGFRALRRPGGRQPASLRPNRSVAMKTVEQRQESGAD
ncbi:MAG: hypothetical protein R8L07_17495 [Alphaproteobacteria bacterium]|nr:hypothetical protein [Alphaproteobacteria bacterium]